MDVYLSDIDVKGYADEQNISWENIAPFVRDHMGIQLFWKGRKNFDTALTGSDARDVIADLERYLADDNPIIVRVVSTQHFLLATGLCSSSLSQGVLTVNDPGNRYPTGRMPFRDLRGLASPLNRSSSTRGLQAVQTANIGLKSGMNLAVEPRIW
jgi:hypothetical protein